MDKTNNPLKVWFFLQFIDVVMTSEFNNFDKNTLNEESHLSVFGEAVVKGKGGGGIK